MRVKFVYEKTSTLSNIFKIIMKKKSPISSFELFSYFEVLLLTFSEFSSQLPSEGGAFYTVDTMDSSRPHYKRAWPAILYAASLWLKETGFTSVDKEESRPANMKADESDSDRFHLLLGEYICSG